MAMTVETTKVITIDEKTRAVDDCSDAVKRLVAYYDDWKQKQADAQSDLLLVQSGMRELSREIVAQIQKEEAEAEAGGEDATTEDETVAD